MYPGEDVVDVDERCVVERTICGNWWFVFIFAFRASEWTVVVPCDRGRNLCFEEWNME